MRPLVVETLQQSFHERKRNTARRREVDNVGNNDGLEGAPSFEQALYCWGAESEAKDMHE